MAKFHEKTLAFLTILFGVVSLNVILIRTIMLAVQEVKKRYRKRFTVDPDVEQNILTFNPHPNSDCDKEGETRC